MEIACILPAHNEEKILVSSADAVMRWGRRTFGPGFRLVISENGSTDGTKLLSGVIEGAMTILSDTPGKGAAIRRGMARVEADIYLAMDVDLSTRLDSAERLVGAVVGGADVAIASRRMPDSEVRRPANRRLITAGYAALSSVFLDLGVRDAQCGCKAFSRRARDFILTDVKDGGFFFDTELLARARRAGLVIREIGVRWEETEDMRRKSKVKLLATSLAFIGKMLTLRDELDV